MEIFQKFNDAIGKLLTDKLLVVLGSLDYLALAAAALWGAFCIVILWRRVAQTRFKSEQEQDEFLDQVQGHLANGGMENVVTLCEGDPRAVPQLILLAIEERGQGYTKVREMISDRFQREVIGDFDHRISWINSMIKAAPMLGLLGTVVGMMEAFYKLSLGQNIDPAQLAASISVALITTFFGLSIAIPLTLIMTTINARIRKFEELVGIALTRFLETIKPLPEFNPSRGGSGHGR